MRFKTPSGRPEPGEYSDAHLEDVGRLPGGDVVAVLRYLPLVAGGKPGD